MDNSIKNKIIELHLTGDYSQSKIAKQFSIAQSSVSKTITAYKNGSFIYNDTTVPEQSTSSFTELPSEKIAIDEKIVSTTSDVVDSIEQLDQSENVDECEQVSEAPINNCNENACTDCEIAPKCEHILEIPTDAELSNSPENQSEYDHISDQTLTPASELETPTVEIAQCEQEQPQSLLLKKAKITYTKHGLWLNEYALKLLERPTHLAYSFDDINSKLCIEPFLESNYYPTIYCTAKCCNNYAKTINKQLVNDLENTLKHKFENNIVVDFVKDTYKIYFNFIFENGQYIIDLNKDISQVDLKVN